MRIFSILIFSLLFGLSGCSVQTYHGIDLSHHNGKIDWTVVAENDFIEFVYLKATEGKTYTDPLYFENLKAAREEGLKVGSYHYFRMTSGAHDQFNHMKQVVKREQQDLIPMVDVETADKHPIAEVRDSLKVFLRLVEDFYGVKPMIYGTNRSYNELCGIQFNHYKLYLGRYGENPPLIAGKEHYTIWQFSERGRLKGIQKTVDLCRFHSKHSLKDILYIRNDTGSKRGIDLSHHNEVVDWSKVDAAFVYLKATEGTTWRDPKYATFLEMAQKHNILVGAYHFMTTSSSAKTQFESFKTVVPKGSIDLYPVLDIERCTKGYPKTKLELQEMVEEWCGLCKEYYGVWPMLYSSLGFYLRNFKGKFDHLYFWCGDVDALKIYVNLKPWFLWQYTIDSVPGIMGKVDINILNSKSDLSEIQFE